MNCFRSPKNNEQFLLKIQGYLSNEKRNGLVAYSVLFVYEITNHLSSDIKKMDIERDNVQVFLRI